MSDITFIINIFMFFAEKFCNSTTLLACVPSTSHRKAGPIWWSLTTPRHGWSSALLQDRVTSLGGPYWAVLAQLPSFKEKLRTNQRIQLCYLHAEIRVETAWSKKPFILPALQSRLKTTPTTHLRTLPATGTPSIYTYWNWKRWVAAFCLRFCALVNEPRENGHNAHVVADTYKIYNGCAPHL